MQRAGGPGSAGDYLSNLSPHGEPNDGAEQTGKRKFPLPNVGSAFSGVSSEMGRRTSEMTSGFANIAERGSSDIRSLASGAKSGVRNVAERGTSDFKKTTSEVGQRTSEISSGFASATERGSSDVRSLARSATSSVQNVASGAKSGIGNVAKRGSRDFKRTTLRAQRVVTKTAGLSDLRFFDPNFEVVSFTPVKAEEIAAWIDAQAKSGSEAVGSKAKSLVLNFTGKKEYEFGDVAKKMVRRVSSHEVNAQDAILLLKVRVFSAFERVRHFIVIALVQFTFPKG